MSTMTVASPQLPSPSPAGTTGQKLQVLSNHFLIDPTVMPDFVYKCNVDYRRQDGANKPSIGRCKRRILELLLQKSDFQMVYTDYEKTLWSFRDLTNGRTGSVVDVDYFEPEESGPRTGSQQLIYQVRLTSAADRLPTEPLKALLKDSKSVINRPLQEYEDALNNMFLRFPGQHKHLTTAGRGTKVFPLGDFPSHSVAKTKDLTGGLTAVRGYSRAAKLLRGGPYLVLNTTCCATYTAGPSSALITSWRRANGNDFAGMNSFITGVKVRARFGDQTRVKRVIGLGSNNADQTTFECDSIPSPDGKVSVRRFFKETHGVDVPPTDHVLNVGIPGKSMYWPASITEVLPGQTYKSLLPLPAQAEAMIQHACRGPNDNKALIMSEGFDCLGLRRESGTSNGVLPGGQLKMLLDMATCNARRLPTPAIVFKNNKAIKNTGSGQWNLSGIVFKEPPKAARVVFTVVTLKQAKQGPINNFKNFGSTLTSDIARYCGKAASYEKGKEVIDWPEQENPAKVLINYFELCHKNGVQHCFLIPSSRSWYPAIKIAANRVGIQTTVTLRKSDNTVKASPGELALLILKFNYKNGGINHAIGPQDFEKIAGPQTMVLGLDVTHPGPSALGGTPSIIGLVHSVRPNPAEFLPVVQLQVPEKGKMAKELVDRLDSMILIALQRWKSRNNNALPKNLIMVRDGVSDAQLNQLLTTELPAIRRACKQIYKDQPLPMINMIVTQKRHACRFFKLADKSSDFAFDPKGNPLPGLIVDQKIASRVRDDWYCTAHKCLQGTSRPAHHTSIVNEIGLTKDEQQQLILNLSFVYPRKSIIEPQCLCANNY